MFGQCLLVRQAGRGGGKGQFDDDAHRAIAGKLAGDRCRVARHDRWRERLGGRLLAGLGMNPERAGKRQRPCKYLLHDSPPPSRCGDWSSPENRPQPVRRQGGFPDARTPGPIRSCDRPGSAGIRFQFTLRYPRPHGLLASVLIPSTSGLFLNQRFVNNEPIRKALYPFYIRSLLPGKPCRISPQERRFLIPSTSGLDSNSRTRPAQSTGIRLNPFYIRSRFKRTKKSKPAWSSLS